MKITILSLFPEILEGFLKSSIFNNAVKAGIVEYNIVNFRDFSTGSYNKVDDEVFGGGAGMLLKPEPLFKALDSIGAKGKRVVFPTPSGKKFNQKYAQDLSKEKELVFIAGHYEGLDQRVIENYVTDEICIGDYVMTSGEVAILAIIDATFRLIDGVINKESLVDESFGTGNLLEYPQYTRPAEYCNFYVPSVLLSGNHAKIKNWRRAKSIEKTLSNRPDLLTYDNLSSDDKKLLENLKTDNEHF